MRTSGFATPSLDWDSPNIPDAFRSFRQYCLLIFDGPYSAKTEQEVTYLLLWIGRHGVDVYNSWTSDNEMDKHKLRTVWEKFEKHIEPKVNSFLARYHFHKCYQMPTGSIDEYITRCRLLASKCKFTDVMETNIRLTEQLIVGTRHREVQEKLLEKGDALDSLDTALDIARTYEATQAHLAQMPEASKSTSTPTSAGKRSPLETPLAAAKQMRTLWRESW